MKLQIDSSIYLELLEHKHCQELFELSAANRIHLGQWMPWVHNLDSIEYIENYIRGTNKRNLEGLEYAFVIIEKDKIVGRIGLYKIETKNKIGELGYWIGEAFQGKGHITKSCKNLIEFAFTTLSLNRLEIKCGRENLKSQKIPPLLNFTYEGILRQGEQHVDKFIDLKLYSLLRDEWQSR